MDFAADPNGDGKFRDRVDIINMSLGSDYGQPFDDDLSAAVKTPRTGHPDGRLGGQRIGQALRPWHACRNEDGAFGRADGRSDRFPAVDADHRSSVDRGSFPAVFQPWSAPLTAAIQAPLQYGNGAGGNLDGCAAFPAGSLAGKIVLVDRGACNFTLKIKNVGDAGGLIGIIGLIAPGDPFEGGDGGDRPITIPGYMVSQAVANRLRSGLPNTVVRFDPKVGIALAGSMVGSSSRGPQHEDTTLIKPEIGAPGASVSAIAGTGTGEGPFGGTSGAAPMVAGSAALVLQAHGGTKATAKGTPPGNAIGHGLSPLEVKALLMNTGEINIVNDPLTGALAPITRIGGGEVRVNRAVTRRLRPGTRTCPPARWASASSMCGRHGEHHQDRADPQSRQQGPHLHGDADFPLRG